MWNYASLWYGSFTKYFVQNYEIIATGHVILEQQQFKRLKYSALCLLLLYHNVDFWGWSRWSHAARFIVPVACIYLSGTAVIWYDTTAGVPGTGTEYCCTIIFFSHEDILYQWCHEVSLLYIPVRTRSLWEDNLVGLFPCASTLFLRFYDVCCNCCTFDAFTRRPKLIHQ